MTFQWDVHKMKDDWFKKKKKKKLYALNPLVDSFKLGLLSLSLRIYCLINYNRNANFQFSNVKFKYGREY